MGARRSVARLGLGIGFLLAGIGLLIYSAMVSQWFLATFGLGGTAPGGSNETDVTGLAAPSFAAYVPIAVFGLGLALIGIGGNFLRGLLMASAMGPGMDRAGPPNELLARMEQQMTKPSGSPASGQAPGGTEIAGPGERTIIKVKCRNCGFLEREDAGYCSSCGQPL